MKHLILILIALNWTLVGCSKSPKFHSGEEPSSAAAEAGTGEVATPPIVNVPEIPGQDDTVIYSKELMCGGARIQGKYLVAGGVDECTMPHTNDQSCDRWGCAVTVNAQGDADCPAGTIKRVMTQEPLYILCYRKVITDGPVASVCGGTRVIGKTSSPDECSEYPTNDMSCNRWGCAQMKDPSSGESFCPLDTQTVRISDNWTTVLCLDRQ